MNKSYMQQMLAETNPLDLQDKGQSQLALKGAEGFAAASGAADSADIASTTKQAMFGNREPQRGFERALHSFLSGVTDEKKREKALKMGETFKKIEEIGLSAAHDAEKSRITKIADEKAAQEIGAFLPYLKDAPADKRFEILDSIIKTHNADVGGDVKLFSVDGVDPYKVTVLKDGQAVAANLLDLPAFKEYKAQTQREQYLKWANDREKKKEENEAARIKLAGQGVTQRDEQLKIQKIKATTQATAVKNTSDPDVQYKKSTAISQGKEGAKTKFKLEEANRGLEENLQVLKEMQDILKRDEVITGNSFAANMQRKIGRSAGTKAWTDTEVFDALSKGLYSLVKDANAKFGNVNVKEFEFLIQPIPDSNKTRAALDILLDRYQDKVERTMLKNKNEILKYGDYSAGADTLSKTPAIQKKVEIPEGMVRMLAKDGKTKVDIPLANIQEFTSGGWTVLQ